MTTPPLPLPDIDNPERPYLLVALTGSIGTGKSAVADRLARCGAHIIDADLLARQVAASGSEALREIAAHFGEGVLDSHGELDRRRLGEIVFRLPAERRWLEECLHPRIRESFYRAVSDNVQALADAPRGAKRHLVVYVVPLLFESPSPRTEFDYIVVVSAERETSLRRIIARDRCSRELAEKKLDSQLPIHQKVALADYCISNEGPLEELDRSVPALYATLVTLPPRSHARL